MLFNSRGSFDIFMKQLQKRALFTREGEIHFIKLAQAGDLEARNEIVESNMRLIISSAKKYRKHSIPFLELIQEGSIGLIRAIEKFDITKGFRFSTYAVWWINQAMSRNLSNESRTIRIPVHMVEISIKMWKISKLMSIYLGHEPSEQEVAEHLELPLEKVRKIFLIVKQPYSLDLPIDKNDPSNTILDIVEDENFVSQDQRIEKTDAEIAVRRSLRTLSPNEEAVLRMRYGVGE